MGKMYWKLISIAVLKIPIPIDETIEVPKWFFDSCFESNKTPGITCVSALELCRLFGFYVEKESEKDMDTVTNLETTGNHKDSPIHGKFMH